eukprot:1270899-Rhodomonas_salina.1
MRSQGLSQAFQTMTLVCDKQEMDKAWRPFTQYEIKHSARGKASFERATSFATAHFLTGLWVGLLSPLPRADAGSLPGSRRTSAGVSRRPPRGGTLNEAGSLRLTAGTGCGTGEGHP